METLIQISAMRLDALVLLSSLFFVGLVTYFPKVEQRSADQKQAYAATFTQPVVKPDPQRPPGKPRRA